MIIFDEQDWQHSEYRYPQKKRVKKLYSNIVKGWKKVDFGPATYKIVVQRMLLIKAHYYYFMFL